MEFSFIRPVKRKNKWVALRIDYIMIIYLNGLKNIPIWEHAEIVHGHHQRSRTLVSFFQQLAPFQWARKGTSYLESRFDELSVTPRSHRIKMWVITRASGLTSIVGKYFDSSVPCTPPP
jgi:hypothetical protein